jgi:CheY-like chemotaxis protein
MQAKIKNILLVCSDARESGLLQELFSQLAASIHITVAANGRELSALLKESTPDLIVMRMDNKKEGNQRLLNVIRKNERLDEIPVFVYTAVPGKKDLQRLLKTWRRLLSFLPL